MIERKRFYHTKYGEKKEDEIIDIVIVIFRDDFRMGTSISVRTPNDEEKELDYEFSIKIEDTNGKINIY